MDREPEYAPFAQQILALASRFKIKAIRQLLARKLNTPPLP